MNRPLHNSYKLSLALITCSLFSSVSSGVYLSSSSIGEALIYPYYTVNGENSTLISILNTTPNGKAIKVRFLEGYDGRDSLDFNLYMSPYDVWVGQISALQGGGAGIFTNDNSCTVPALPHSLDNALSFSTVSFDGTGVQGLDGGPTDVSRTREGHIEIIEMGTVTNATQDSLTAISHADGVPINCGQISEAWHAGGYWSQDPNVDLAAPSGGLAGQGTILDIAAGTVEAYVADALAGFYLPDSNAIHTNPNDLKPNIGSGSSTSAYVFLNDIPKALDYSRSIDAVSAVFMTASLQNEYWTGQGIAAASEWVVTFPTKRFYVDPYYVKQSAIQPFENVFTGESSPTAQSSSAVRLSYFNREEKPLDPCFNVNPCRHPTPSPTLKYDSQVVTFNQNDLGTSSYSVIGSSLILSSNLTSLNVNTGAAYGWALVDLTSQDGQQALTDAQGNTLKGLPATGFWAGQFINGDINGVLANFTAAYKHKTSSICTKSSGGSC